MGNSDFIEEFFVCPECALKTKVIWDPGQSEREIDCIHCRRDSNEPVPVLDENGDQVMSQNSLGEDTPVFEYKHVQLGCRYSIERGKGVK
jgi:hypothetical protein